MILPPCLSPPSCVVQPVSSPLAASGIEFVSLTYSATTPASSVARSRRSECLMRSPQKSYLEACIALSNLDGLGLDLAERRSVVLAPKRAQSFSEAEVEKMAEAIEEPDLSTIVL